MRRFLAFVVGLALVQGVGAETFRFLYQAGDQYRYLGSSTQRVTLDGQFLQDALLSYRIQFKVAEALPDGSGHLVGHISYLTQRNGEASAIDQEYDTDYVTDAVGRYTVPATQVMPVVRHVPTFPSGDLKPGDTWTARGEEVHDLSRDFGVKDPLHVPFDVSYSYEGTVERDGHTVHVIRSDYSIYQATGIRDRTLKVYPVRFSGHSTQRHYFNLEKGREEGYDEDYSLVLSLNDGRQVEYAGTGESHLEEAQVMDRPAVAAEVKKGLEDAGLGNVEVKVVPQGVTINLDNIQFPPDSAELLPSEQDKVRRIGEILKQFAGRDILVEGHTAVAPSRVDPQTLSENRAAAVGNALVALGVRDPDHIVYRGWGGSRPLASNDTEAGRAKNRRVEITLLEN